MKQTLRNLIANGKTKQALEQILSATASDGDLHNRLSFRKILSFLERLSRLRLFKTPIKSTILTILITPTFHKQ
jgi:hypothetical protein